MVDDVPLLGAFEVVGISWRLLLAWSFVVGDVSTLEALEDGSDFLSVGCELLVCGLDFTL